MTRITEALHLDEEEIQRLPFNHTDWLYGTKILNRKEREQTDNQYKRVVLNYLKKLNYDIQYLEEEKKEMKEKEDEEIGDVDGEYDEIECMENEQELNVIDAVVFNSLISSRNSNIRD